MRLKRGKQNRYNPLSSIGNQAQLAVSSTPSKPDT
jgi:hypothetical protein